MGRRNQRSPLSATLPEFAGQHRQPDRGRCSGSARSPHRRAHPRSRGDSGDAGDADYWRRVDRGVAGLGSFSYTHLDVYKRQVSLRLPEDPDIGLLGAVVRFASIDGAITLPQLLAFSGRREKGEGESGGVGHGCSPVRVKGYTVAHCLFSWPMIPAALHAA